MVFLLAVAGLAAAVGMAWGNTKDVPESHWAYKAINFLVENGILKGYVDGTFKPDQKVSRAEMAATLHNYQNWREFGRRPEEVKRGCLACHVNIPNYMDVRLAAEAKKVAPEAHAGLDEDAGLAECAECHGVSAIAMNDIVHPAHYNSPIFMEHYFGNCWTCHRIVNHEYVVLEQALPVKANGVPSHR
jgi:hypothetical protein